MAEDARVFQIKLSAGLIIRSGSALFFFIEVGSVQLMGLKPMVSR